jgi:hypothetical protein
MIPLDRTLSFRFPLLSGADVRQAQQALRRAGQGVMPTDGVFGPTTRDAVLQFQRAQGLVADGVLGPATWARLMQAAPPATTAADWRAMLQPFCARLTEEHGAPVGNSPRRWKLTVDGLVIDGTLRRAGTPTVARAWANHGAAMQAAARAQAVPVELLLACACTESGGRADAMREEPGYLDDQTTPNRVSPGLMQTLISTAREALNDPKLDRARLLDPETALAAGGAYIRRQAIQARVPTGFDPPLVAIAYNAGSLRAADNQPNNLWGLVQTRRGDGWHADAFCGFLNDGFTVLSAVPPDAETPSFLSLLRGQ